MRTEKKKCACCLFSIGFQVDYVCKSLMANKNTVISWRYSFNRPDRAKRISQLGSIAMKKRRAINPKYKEVAEKYYRLTKGSEKRRQQKLAADAKRSKTEKRKRWIKNWKKAKLLDSAFLIAQKSRVRISMAIRDYSKTGKKHFKTEDLIGCSFSEYAAYLESKFENGMNWNNYGMNGWSIDHIRPCASFDLTDAQQQKQCFHYTNTQPMWFKENCSKNKYYGN